MINTIIFDFGDIFINLKQRDVEEAFTNLGMKEWGEELKSLNIQFETAKISEADFLNGLRNHAPSATIEEIRSAWNSMLGEFPLYRLEFLQLLSQQYRLFLLSNTDAIHIAHFEEMVGPSFLSDFYQCFEKVYFSFELGLRKPEEEIFNYIINKHELSPKRTLFVDDKKDNTDIAEKLGLQIWNLQVGEEDVVHLFDKKIIEL
ncbi:MAG: HAD family phosphatase [Flavobacterium sp.]|nr:HAD family phosphatase [Flavobacterium sp.]